MMSRQNREHAFLQLLAQQYPSIRAVTTELIHLRSRLVLPKGTEHFVSDIHGAHEAFHHVLKNGSGSIRRKIDELFDTLPENDKGQLATLIYYPMEWLYTASRSIADIDEWNRMTILRLIRLTRHVSAKYTRSEVLQHVPPEVSDIVETLIFENRDVEERTSYYQSVVNSIISTRSAKDFIVILCELIQKLTVAHLHVIGDIYDRGPGAEHIMDMLMEYHSVDIQWGNHDILWMGAASGSLACIANVLRVSLRYANTDTLETGYGISLLPLASFAINMYDQDSCEQFRPREVNDPEFTEQEIRLLAQMHKAITIIQLKLEGQLIQRRKHYQMDSRLLLDKIDYAKHTIEIDDTTYPLLDHNFPTLYAEDPYTLTEEEKIVMERLRLSFSKSHRLQQHARFLFANGSMYLVNNENLLYHGCIAFNDNGSFQKFIVDDEEYTAKAFMDRLDQLARQGYFGKEGSDEKQYGLDAMWYLWSGAQSPLFGKDKMATFERYFIADKSTHIERRNAYYRLRNSEEIARKILVEFGLNPQTGHIINGHVPVKVKQGESPIKANGRLLVIDGGFAKAYQSVTGIAGYTLIFNSHGLLLASHQPFESSDKAIEDGVDLISKLEILETKPERLLIQDTDEGKRILDQIHDLERLLDAFRAGIIKVN